MNRQTANQTQQKSQTATPVSGNILQRKCACGNHAQGGECEECHKKKQILQRSPSKGEGHSEREVPPIVHEVLRSPGQPLDPATRTFFEPRFGHDFSQVRMHTDAKAAESARAVNAMAYTIGRDVVFGEGDYEPHTDTGRALLAHELTHTIQQPHRTRPETSLKMGAPGDRYEREANNWVDRFAGPSAATASEGVAPPALGVSKPNEIITPTSGHLLQRQTTTERLGGLLSDPRVQAVGGFGARLASEWLADPRNRQFASDIEASVREAPQHVGEFLTGEVWEAIREHWPQILAVTLGLLAAEMIIGILTGAPEPTMLTKVAAVILQIVVIAVLGYFAIVEVAGAYEAGRNWLSLARRANGDPPTITEASRSFVRMVWHIVMAVLVVAGVRARIRGATIPRAGATTGGSTSGSAAAAGEGGSVIPISSHPRFQPRVGPSVSSPRASSGSAFEGSAARRLEPLEQPVAPQPAPAPATALGTPRTGAPRPGPGVQPVPAAAAGESAATSSGRPPNAMRFQVQWDTNNRGPTFSQIAVAQNNPGVTTQQAIGSLNAALALVVPSAAQTAAAPAVARQTAWILGRPPAGIAIGGYSRSEYFPYRRYTDARVDVENLRGHNLRI